MADLLFWFYTEGDEKGDLELELSVIDDFTDEGLCARYHFQQESILFITNLVTGVIIYKQQFLHSDWLRTCQLIPN